MKDKRVNQLKSTSPEQVRQSSKLLLEIQAVKVLPNSNPIKMPKPDTFSYLEKLPLTDKP